MARVPLESVANIYEAGGPNTINRENVRRRIVLQCNVSERGVVDVVTDIQKKLAPIAATLPPGYFVEYGGQFQSQKEASRILGVLVYCLADRRIPDAVCDVSFCQSESAGHGRIADGIYRQCVAALVHYRPDTDDRRDGRASFRLAGIASRNGILLLNHYLHLVKYEGETWSHSMIIRAGLERLAPVLMTALTAGIGLVPLVLAAGEPGKEILYPVATVILGGVISSTLLDFFVHPALFWLFGLKEAQRVVNEAHGRDSTG